MQAWQVLVPRAGADYEYTLPNGKKIEYKKGYKIYDDYNNVKYELKGNDEWTQDMAYNDMKNNPVYKQIKNSDELITDINELRNLPMYKVNENFITIARDNGYTILNIGNPLNLSEESLFFKMEKIKMGF